MHHLLWDGLKSLGLQSFVENDADRLCTVNTIKVCVCARTSLVGMCLGGMRLCSRAQCSCASHQHRAEALAPVWAPAKGTQLWPWAHALNEGR